MSMAMWLGGGGGADGEEQSLGDYLLDHMKDSPEWHPHDWLIACLAKTLF